MPKFEKPFEVARATAATMLALIAVGVDAHVARSETLLNFDKLESGEAPDAVAKAIHDALPEHLRTQRPRSAFDDILQRTRNNGQQQQTGDKAAQFIARKREARSKVPNPINAERKR